MDRTEVLKIFTCIIRRLTDVFDTLTKDEDLRKFGNSITAILHNYNSIIAVEEVSEEEQDTIELRAEFESFKKWRATQ